MYSSEVHIGARWTLLYVCMSKVHNPECYVQLGWSGALSSQLRACLVTD